MTAGPTDYRDRVMACWLGKAVGGTLGQAFEGRDGPLDAQFYHPVPTEMVPNDDLDLQVVWATVIAGMDTPKVSSEVLVQAWLRHVEFPYNEYGVAKRNLREGLHPPASGSHDNWFACGEGAAIRSELWACLAPTDPSRAAGYAAIDAEIDHAGEGIYAEMFLAAMQSAAFGSDDMQALLRAGLAAIPGDCDLARVVTATHRWVHDGLDWQAVRARILDNFGAVDFTDVRMNTGFVVLGLLAGNGDFERSVLITNNCGKDTDSTTATVGATLGIISPDGIPQRWLEPIGRDLVLSDGIVGLTAPDTLQQFTDLVESLRKQIDSGAGSGVATHRSGAVAASEVAPRDPITVDAAFFTLAGDHRNLDTWFLPGPGTGPPEWPAAMDRRPIGGTWCRMPADAFEDDLLMLGYPVRLDRAMAVRIMVAATVPCRVWFDGQWLFGRDGGPMFPAPHMPRLNTYADLTISAGDHELRVVLQRPGDHEMAEWVVAVADSDSKEWIPDALRPSMVAAR